MGLRVRVNGVIGEQIRFRTAFGAEKLYGRGIAVRQEDVIPGDGGEINRGVAGEVGDEDGVFVEQGADFRRGKS